MQRYKVKVLICFSVLLQIGQLNEFIDTLLVPSQQHTQWYRLTTALCWTRTWDLLITSWAIYHCATVACQKLLQWVPLGTILVTTTLLPSSMKYSSAIYIGRCLLAWTFEQERITVSGCQLVRLPYFGTKRSSWGGELRCNEVSQVHIWASRTMCSDKNKTKWVSLYHTLNLYFIWLCTGYMQLDGKKMFTSGQIST